jgi:DNA-binding ferritin-like protein
LINKNQKAYNGKVYKSISDKAGKHFLCLMQKTWVYHWNVVGSEFFQFHKAFGESIQQMFEEIDRSD